MTISTKGIQFVVGHEGFVSRAYRDVANVWTIGTGFTNRSAVARELIGPISAGKTITPEQNARVLQEAFAREYGPPVDRAMVGGKQHELDAGYSYCFNCGPGAMNDQWVRFWQTGDKKGAGNKLKTSRVTAGGRYIQGLANRRASEARLLVYGDYGSIKPVTEPRKSPAEFIAMLEDLGYTQPNIVLKFQKNHPNLVNDDILGPATQAQILRDIDAKNEGAGTGAIVIIGGGIASILATYGSVIGVAVGVVVVGAIVWFVARRREEVTHWIKNLKDD